MNFVSARYMRFLTHAVCSKRAAEQYIQQLSVQEKILLIHARTIGEIYDLIEGAAKEGRGMVHLRPTHLFWQTPSVQGIFMEKGFKLDLEKNTIQWHDCPELK